LGISFIFCRYFVCGFLAFPIGMLAFSLKFQQNSPMQLNFLVSREPTPNTVLTVIHLILSNFHPF
jgi:hypothetical protein